MNVTLENIAKWQPPSVLHLLPFSKNNAGTAISNNMVTAKSNQLASYVEKGNISNKELPNLRSNTQSREKPRSKSAVVMEHKLNIHQQDQQQRLFRASSERLSRSPKKPSGGRNFIERARSEYVVKSDRKLTQEVVTFAIKDINEQILGHTSKNENESSDLDKNNAVENGRYKVKSLLKPVMRPNERRWPQTSARFWRSSTISPGERELQRHKISLDAQLSALKRSKMIKLNVKDLPRSQTPIGENDPDKLNMKQVIAFLQSSGDVRDANDDEKRRIKSGNNGKENKIEKSKEIGRDTENKESAAALVIAAKSRRKDESYDKSNRTNKVGSAKSIQSNKPDQNSKHSVSKTADNNNMDPAVKPRPHSYNGEIPSDHKEDEKHYQDRNDNNQRNPRPSSLQFLRENTEFRIPAGIRQIRESTIDNRPFRLHRFLTLVSSTPEEATLSKRKANSRMNVNNNSRFNSPLQQHNNNNRSPSNFSKTKDDEKEGKTYTDSNGFFLTENVFSRNEVEKKKEGRRRSKFTRSPIQSKIEAENSNGSGKIICLPTAPVDVDSDDDSNFISLPTVPSKSTRKDLVLSANGHAILNKHFPQVQTFQKATIRPHSEKITLKRRLEISGEIKTRPSTVKPKDLIEWGGVENPERIFLSDTKDNDFSPRPTNKNTKNVTDNGELTGKCLKEVNQDSLHRSENSCDHGKTVTTSPGRSKISDDVITFPSENQNADASSDISKDAVVGKNMTKTDSSNGAKSKPESVSPTLSDPVRLTLRKERNLTREKTYMVDMESTGDDDFGQKSKFTFDSSVR